MDENYEEKYFEQERTYWWFKGRRDLISRVPVSSLDKILEVGCGSGQNLLIWKNNETLGLDISHAAVEKAKEYGIKVVQGDLNKELPFDKESFDIIFALDVIEHLEDDNESVKKLTALLKKGGRLVINVPAFQSVWSYHDKQNMHKKRYLKKEVQKLAKGNGLKQEKCSYWNFTLFPVVYATVRLDRLRNKKESHIRETSNFINKVLFNVLKLENKLIHIGIKFPFGTSVFYIGRKD